VNVVDEFPRRCPLGTPNALAAIGQLQGAAWRELGRSPTDPDADHGGALGWLDRTDVCLACVSRLAGHPTIRRLRRGKGVGS